MPLILGQQQEMRHFQNRFFIVFVILCCIFAFVIGRLWFLQVMQGVRFYSFSQQNFLKQEKIQAPRGMIYDRNGLTLVDNYPSFDVVITPQFLPRDQVDQTIQLLGRLIGLTPDEIRIKLTKAKRAPRFQPVVIKTDINKDEVGLVESHSLDLPGVDIQQIIKRTYLFKEVGASLFGYIGEINQKELDRFNKNTPVPYLPGDFVGKAGIEVQFEKILRGIDGATYSEVDAFGRRKLPGEESLVGATIEKPANPGDNLVLTIDQDLQNTAYEAFGEKIGALVALDPNNGEVLAMVSRPSFDSTEFSRGIDPEDWKNLIADPYDPLRNKAIQNHYPPGSTYKTFTLLSGLQSGAITLGTKFKCSGSMVYGRRRYHCWKKEGHGIVGVNKSIAESCDVFYYRTGIATGVDGMAEYATAFGLGQETGIELPGEETGLIPTKAWKERRFGKPWIPGETLSQAIGQGFVLVTPLQLALSYSAIANNGTLYKPQIIKRVESPEGDILSETKPDIIKKLEIPDPYLKATQEALFSAVNQPRGTGYWTVRSPKIKIAGKTGTVQVIRLGATDVYKKCEEMEFRFRHHGWFVGYAPADNPQIVVAALAEHSCHGSSGAGPIVKQVILKYLEDKAELEKEKTKAMPEGSEVEDLQTRPEELKQTSEGE
ncbi:penicillin-binding protein 2 [Bdellovibrionota bacterium]